MNNSEKKFLFNLLSAPSPTGFETEGQKVWVKYVKKYVLRCNPIVLFYLYILAQHS